jgi:hypothetical protein
VSTRISERALDSKSRGVLRGMRVSISTGTEREACRVIFVSVRVCAYDSVASR